MENSWTKRIVTYDWLKEMADLVNPEPLSMVVWLQIIGVIPFSVNWKRGNRVPNTSLDPNNIQAGYLAEVAFDFDQIGHATPTEFLNWLSFEVAGTPENESMKRVLGELTQEATTSWSD